MEEMPSDRQIKYATDIARDLNIELPENIHISRAVCKKFLDTFSNQHKQFKSNGYVVKSSIANTSITNKSTNSADNPYDQILSYWLDAIIRTSFQSLGSLPSQLENCSSFPYDKIEHFLNSNHCKDLTNIHDQETVRHLVLRLASKSKNSPDKSFAVILVFPLKIVAINESDKGNLLPYKWQRCQDELPLFNPKLMGEYADIEGLNLYNVDDLNNLLESAIENVNLFSAQADLKECLKFLDKCFDALTGDGGLASYVQRFDRNKLEVPKLKNKILEFILVDGNAAGGATRQVQICYEEIIQSKITTKSNCLNLLRQLMMGFRDKNENANEFDDESVVMGWAKAEDYLGHMDNAGIDGKRHCYPLDNPQRMALTLLRKTNDGHLLAVNGPPGTGKTSLLRAVIADIWVNALLTDDNLPNCPLILASAATNQAVTNIISSFDQVPAAQLFDDAGQILEDVSIYLESRWIPGLKSYGWFVPASLDSKKEATQINYQVLLRDKGNSFWKFHYAAEAFGKLPSTIIEKSYIAVARRYFNNKDLSLNKIIKKLHSNVKTQTANVKQLGEALTSWVNQLTALHNIPWDKQHEERYDTMSLICLPWEGEEGRKNMLEKIMKNIQKNINVLNKALDSLNAHRENNFIYKLKCFLAGFFRKKVKANKWNDLREIITAYGVSLPAEPVPSDWDAAILARIRILQSDYSATQLEYQKEYANYESYQQQLLPLKEYRQRHFQALHQSEQAQWQLITILENLFNNNDNNLIDKIKRGIDIIFSTKDSLNEIFFMPIIAELQAGLDKHIRPQLFHMTARYWEGRYIAYKKRKKQKLKLTPNLIIPAEEHFCELAMLAPVFVVTTFSAPKLMKRTKVESKEYPVPYLFDFADLLIIDEAGQATPEIGACAFAFAKRAIVVGDIKQLAPVWNIEWPIDRLMIRKHQLEKSLRKNSITSELALMEYGLLTSKGCIMKMAQCATAFYDIDFDDRGVMLTNHYRCRGPIIEICNQMVYEGALKVVISATEPHHEWHNPLGFLVTASESTRLSTGSRCNYKEAELIASWIKEQRLSIITHYNNDNKDKPLDLADLLAVLTPYKGQVPEIKKALAKALGEDPLDSNALTNRMTIGTVHSLQGAEKNIIIFSMVDTVDPTSNHFYDDNESLINVAISRAKEVFITTIDQNAINYAKTITEVRLKKPSDYIWYYTVLSGKRLNPCQLILVESPNKIRNIESALLQGMALEVVATNGHLTQLDANFNWDPLNIEAPRWQNLTEKELQVYNRVATLWNDIDAIYIATDPDAEGECIAWHFINRIKDHIPLSLGKQKKSPDIKRMRFHSLVKEEICHAYENASEGLDAGLVKSSLVRTILDQIFARHYPSKLKVGKSNKFYAGIGRVQLAILDIVNQFDNRQKQYAIQIEIPLQGQAGKMLFYLDCYNQQKPTLFNDQRSALSKASVFQQMCASDVIIKSLWKSKVKQLPEYPAINTATFLSLASRIYKMHPKRTMEVLQALYEGQTQITEEVVDV